ncbi:hypothetical protein MRB53_035698 [Persea americana]|uniref:Uncharacterized protein n=1 Tax=Persea americana TaxID=3435 RepID=A0ACC2K5M2_PERAE|nr:hypothetical protein MRB53_035698 [Persea americana]
MTTSRRSSIVIIAHNRGQFDIARREVSTFPPLFSFFFSLSDLLPPANLRDSVHFRPIFDLIRQDPEGKLLLYGDSVRIRRLSPPVAGRSPAL